MILSLSFSETEYSGQKIAYQYKKLDIKKAHKFVSFFYAKY